jgi:diguanylate cyclase (GGDEF)-like protein/PAS domain S-box-containing protein
MMDKDCFDLIDIVESVNAIIWEYNIEDDKWEYVSPQTRSILGYEPYEWKDMSFWLNNIHNEDRSWAKNYCLSCTRKGEDHIFEYRFMRKDGEYIWIRDEVVVVMDAGEPVKIRGFMTNITELKIREEKTKYISFHDELTGLYNRRYFEKEMERLDNSRNKPIAIVIGDLDDLKYINDNYGHKNGDKYIIKTADIMRNNFRDEDIVARIGGDEFAVILPNTDYKTAGSICRRIKKQCKENNKYRMLSISMGYEVKNNNSASLEEIFIQADKKLYEEKQTKEKHLR